MKIAMKPKSPDSAPEGHLHFMYLPWIHKSVDKEFDNWEAENVVDKWEDMQGWDFLYDVNAQIDGQLTQIEAKMINYLFLFNIVYKVPKIGPSPTKEELEKEVGPIAFRLTFKESNESKKRSPIPGCMVIGSTLGDKRSVSHMCNVHAPPRIAILQMQARFLNPPQEIEQKDKHFI